jgi:hypothetical protein
MTEDDRDRQGRTKEQMRSTYILAFGAVIGLVIISIISMFL